MWPGGTVLASALSQGLSCPTRTSPNADVFSGSTRPGAMVLSPASTPHSKRGQRGRPNLPLPLLTIANRKAFLGSAPRLHSRMAPRRLSRYGSDLLRHGIMENLPSEVRSRHDEMIDDSRPVRKSRVPSHPAFDESGLSSCPRGPHILLPSCGDGNQALLRPRRSLGILGQVCH